MGIRKKLAQAQEAMHEEQRQKAEERQRKAAEQRRQREAAAKQECEVYAERERQRQAHYAERRQAMTRVWSTDPIGYADEIMLKYSGSKEAAFYALLRAFVKHALEN